MSISQSLYAKHFFAFTLFLICLLGCEQSFEPDLSEKSTVINGNSFSMDTLINHTWYLSSGMFTDYDRIVFKSDRTFSIIEPKDVRHNGTWVYNKPKLTLQFLIPPEDYIDKIELTVNSYSTKYQTLYTKTVVYPIDRNTWEVYLDLKKAY